MGAPGVIPPELTQVLGELGIVVITQILTTDGVALAGPLPSEIQSYITFTGGISATSKSIDAAKDLMADLKSPLAVRVMKSQGMEPGTHPPLKN